MENKPTILEYLKVTRGYVLDTFLRTKADRELFEWFTLAIANLSEEEKTKVLEILNNLDCPWLD